MVRATANMNDWTADHRQLAKQLIERAGSCGKSLGVRQLRSATVKASLGQKVADFVHASGHRPLRTSRRFFDRDSRTLSYVEVIEVKMFGPVRKKRSKFPVGTIGPLSYDEISIYARSRMKKIHPQTRILGQDTRSRMTYNAATWPKA